MIFKLCFHKKGGSLMMGIGDLLLEHGFSGIPGLIFNLCF